MTPEERQLLTDLAKKIAQTPAPARDPEAEEFIRTQIGSRPDALYLMTQTVLIQNMAIEHAKQEIDQLKRQQPAPAAPGGSFLGGGGGWGSPQPAYNTPQPQPSYNVPPPMPPQQPSFGGGGGMSSFLKTAGVTAAGVAAGALAFEGIRSMFGGVEHMLGFGGHPGMGSGFLGGGPPVEEVVVNNYYDGPDPRRGDERGLLSDNLGPSDSVQYDSTDVPVDDSSSNDDSV